MSDSYGREEKKQLLKLARETLELYLEDGTKPDEHTENPRFREKRGVFVTLHKHGQLRGCIGHPLPVAPLYRAVIDNAVSSAVEDPRFPPVKKSELKDIDIEISVLTVPQQVADGREVRVGTDGIIISKGFRRGLLLPQVPVEQGWDLEEYLSYGCQKAGLPAAEWRKSRGITIETFQAVVFGEKDDL